MTKTEIIEQFEKYYKGRNEIISYNVNALYCDLTLYNKKLNLYFNLYIDDNTSYITHNNDKMTHYLLFINDLTQIIVDLTYTQKYWKEFKQILEN